MQLEPIAVVGVGCRFPGAKNPQAFWDLLQNGQEGVSEIPASRWDLEAFYTPDGQTPGKGNTKWGGFLENIDYFDPQFFGIAPKEAVTMDPQQRLLLEVAWETLEDAGQIPESLRGSKTGVFIGIGTHDYSIMLWQQPLNEPYATTGTGNCIAANRISYIFDFKGPSLAVDTACSSSLVAVHLACQSIWTGESTQALAGGVNVLLLPTIMVGFSKGGFMSSEGRCKSFDRDADGYVRGEGAGLVLLKPLAQAEADGDDIYGVILSTAVNQDGFSQGLAAPNPKAQAEVLKEAYLRGKIDPSQVDYIEAHGTGTKVGDPIEMEALSAVIGANRQAGDNCLVGSVKTNIGHTETAAGIAGIIKVALALKNKQIPPSLHFNYPNQAIAFGKNGFEVVTALTPWQKDRPMIAGVNSFGFGGTNAHVVMSGFTGIDREVKSNQENEYLLTISAKSQGALRELAESYRALLTEDIDLKDLCVASNLHRSHFNYRLTCVAKSQGQLGKQLAGFVTGKETLGVSSSCRSHQPGKICWMFTGQGSQYEGMGKGLYESQAVFREALDLCGEILKSYWDVPLLSLLFDFDFSQRRRGAKNGFVGDEIHRTKYTQPAIFAVEYALAQLWLSWGIKPDYVMGHSIGEYTAACVAGVFSLEAGLRLVANRGRLMEDLPSAGGMLAVFASQEKVAKLIVGKEKKISIAAINHQENTVIAGEKEILVEIEAKLAELGIKSTRLEVSQAFHSPLMQPMLGDFRAVAERVEFKLPQIPLISNVTGQLADDRVATGDYWLDHIVQPVRFGEGFNYLLQSGIEIFLEIGAKPILAGMGQTILSATGKHTLPLLLPSLSDKQEDRQVILNTVSRLYHQGINLDWRAFHQNYQVKDLKLPTYPFQRQKYWWQDAKFWLKGNFNQQQSYGLLGNKLASDNSNQIIFQQEISASNPKYLADHCLQSQVVFPATGYVELALAVGKEIHGDRKFVLQDFIIKQPLLLSEELTTIKTAFDGDRLQIFSQESILHCEASFGLVEQNIFNSLDLAKIQSELKPVEINNHYQKLRQQCLNYGVNFQGIKQLWQENNRVLGFIEIPQAITSDRDLLHPALLDSCLQLIAAITESVTGVYLPTSITSLQLFKSPGNKVWAEVTLQDSQDQIIKADLKLVNEQGEAIALIENLSLQYLSFTSLAKLIKPTKDLENDLYQITWIEQKLEPDPINNLPNNWLIYSRDRNLAEEFTQAMPGNNILLFPEQKFKIIASNQYEINPLQVKEFNQLRQEIAHQETWGIIYLQDNNSGFKETDPQESAVILHLIQTITNLSQLIIITQQTQIKTNNISTGIWGMARAINLEYPDLKCLCLDLENNNIAIAIKEIKYNHNETQVAYRNQTRYVPRLTPKDNSLNHPFRLQLTDYGTIDNLSLAPLQRRQPQPGEIEIAVTASGVNFRDVLNALGVLQPYLEAMGFADATQVPFGGECAGVVTAVGEGVNNFQVGDRVIAAQAVGSLSSHVLVNAQFAIQQPEHLTDVEAATIPTTFLTAYYGLHYLAQIQPGDKILIHAAAGGVGQAAVQIAQLVGAEVYATASEGKWDFLKAMGIKYVMNSRNLNFAEEIKQLTEGKGVNIILNSLNGDFIPKNLDILAPNGRFIEIGKVGIWDQQQVKERRKDVAYFPFDLLEVSQRDPDLITTLFTELKEKFLNRQLQPLPHQVFPIQSAANAFRYMAQAKHIGKVVISLPGNNPVVKKDGCYLITGGYGALGLQVAQWLVAEGAKHLILIGRSQPSPEIEQAIASLRNQGVTINVSQTDITDYDGVKNIVSNCFQVEQPLGEQPLGEQPLGEQPLGEQPLGEQPLGEQPFAPTLRGIIHAAGILDDGLISTLSWERFQAVLKPKIQGAWNLHQATKDLDLDWFVCFSSITSVFGAVGQSNYATANAYLDNLMNYRRSLGLPGLSINWSIWGEVGMATRMTTPQQQRLQQQGLKAIATQPGLKILKQLIQQQAEQTIVFPVDWQTFLSQQLPNPFFEKLQPQTVTQPEVISSFVQQLTSIPKEKRKMFLREHISLQLAKVLGYSDPEDIDTQEKFADLGMDSLMAVEFKNNLQTSLGNAVSLTAAFDYPTVELLADYIAKEIFGEQLTVSSEQREDPASPTGARECFPPEGGTVNNQQSTVNNQQSTVNNQQSTINNQQSTINNQQSTVNNQQSTGNKELIKRTPVKVKPEYHQFNLTPEYLNLKKDLERVEQLGNPFFSLHQGIAKDTIITNNRQLINYSSYNYLGMSGDPVVTAAAQQAIAEYGTSVSASRLLSGERPLHLELEQEIADLIGTEDAIAYVGGHATNVSTIGHLFGEQDLIICDALSHNSIREGCKLSGATVIDFPHNDLVALETILERERTKYQKVLIAVEGIYSTDGDLAPVPEIIQLKQHYQTFLLVDEAHSIGVLGLSGAGIREHFNLQASDVDLWMGTLSKSFASCGGYIAGSKELIQYLKYTAPGFVFSVGMSPANTAAALAAIRLLKSEPERAIKLQARAKFCLDLAKSKGLNTGYSADSPIIPIIVGEPHKAVSLSQHLKAKGINVNPMVYPSVPYDAARLRFFITSLHTEEQIATTMNILGNED